MAISTGAAILGGSLISGYMANRAAKRGERGARAGIAEQGRQFDLVRGDTKPYRQVGSNAIYRLSNQLGLGDPREQELEAMRARLGATPQMTTETVGGGGGGAYGGWGSPKAHAEAGYQPRGGQTTTREIANPAYADLESEIAGLEAALGEGGGGGGFDFTETPGYQHRFDEGMRAVENSQAARGGRLGGRAMKELTRYGQGEASQEYGNYIERLFRAAGMGGGATNTSANMGANTANAVGNLHMQGANAQAQGYAGMNNAVQGGIGNWITSQYMDRMLAGMEG